MNASRLGLGTVKMGLPYGISNHQVGFAGAKSILRTAKLCGMKVIDTAQSYGESESVLGGMDLEEFRIVTKIKLNTNNSTWTGGDFLSASLQRLNLNELEAMLFHQSEDLLGERGSHLWSQFQECKQAGQVKKLGVSVYTPQEVVEIRARGFKLDLIQLPCNVLDQRFVDELPKYKDEGIEIHARSCFLQGLLLMNPREVPDYFSPFKHFLRDFYELHTKFGLSPLQLCLGFLADIKAIDQVIVGVTSAEQLGDIVSNFNELPEKCFAACRALDQVRPPQFWNPGLWRIHRENVMPEPANRV